MLTAYRLIVVVVVAVAAVVVVAAARGTDRNHRRLLRSHQHPQRRDRSAVFNLLCSRTPRYNFSSTLYPQSCWCIIKVIHIL
jgi:hypothetical protein